MTVVFKNDVEVAPYSEAAKKFLLQLRDDPDRRIDEVWAKLVSKNPALGNDDLAEFLEYLGEVWTIIEDARYETAINKSRRLGDILRARLKRYWAKRFVNAPPDEVPKILKEMERFSENEPRPENPLSDYFPELDIRESSRLRTGFMRFASKGMHALTGEWCDGEVASLTDVAFPQAENTSEDMVRSARRGMP